MGTRYETDVVAWANEQAALLRSGKLSQIDIENIAEEIEDVGKSEKRELASRLAVLLAHLMKWQFQPGRRGSSWQRTIKEQRKSLSRRTDKTPSLKGCLADKEWLDDAWSDAVAIAANETGLDVFPESCIWDIEQILSQGFYPE
ncbi:DUF29 family protein [Photorhabdus laumondii subsp. laumondii]|uniref:Photorhabdus luminescens subsp. laumondii TTO1 complete genome segment 14/17 n=2 Tax=Photorhabdus laumondii subsp. laumondii TaxID=141679 RepID=Q7N0F7_PHOLL|nr:MULTISPECIES: DUF29 domain-containing protein [Photorhabdus]AXG48841.1 DUF29 domain-containing protein [Photorhabdus laumondii subsp. laumondii]KTL60285.1 hypothetical protein AA106_13615 [Photorhabdus laumondii subsp. laumondii]MCC8382724.1 DUF29 domain-containing protein [Photorhabdus laumondii]MCC8411644.1 DUF29 domain-containing protein [Photorhabdus laumondii]NDK94614.1 DUF29 family protein [Photorhabdus laumondii subsp. laumondii]